MPLWKIINPHFEGEIRIWKVEESDDFFLDHLTLTPREQSEVDELSAKRKTEWLAARYLIKQILPNRPLECVKDRHGKPTLLYDPHFISISHSDDLVGVIVSRFLVGLDLQYLVEKITRIAERVVSPEELASRDSDNYIEWLHVEWGAKESMYKAYGLRKLDFRTQMKLEPFSVTTEGETIGHVFLEKYSLDYDVNYLFEDGLCIVYCKLL